MLCFDLVLLKVAAISQFWREHSETSQVCFLAPMTHLNHGPQGLDKMSKKWYTLLNKVTISQELVRQVEFKIFLKLNVICENIFKKGPFLIVL